MHFINFAKNFDKQSEMSNFMIINHFKYDILLTLLLMIRIYGSSQNGTNFVGTLAKWYSFKI